MAFFQLDPEMRKARFEEEIKKSESSAWIEAKATRPRPNPKWRRRRTPWTTS